MKYTYCPGENDKALLNFKFSTKAIFKKKLLASAGFLFCKAHTSLPTAFVVDFLPQCCLYWMFVFVPALGFTNFD